MLSRAVTVTYKKLYQKHLAADLEIPKTIDIIRLCRLREISGPSITRFWEQFSDSQIAHIRPGFKWKHQFAGLG